MIRWTLGKLGHVVSVLFIVSFALAFLLNLTPGDPAFSILGDTATKAQVALIHHQLQLDKPFYVRYWTWVWHLLHGNFGTTYETKQPVLGIIFNRMPITAELIILALIMAFVIAIPIGIYTAYRADGRFDRIWQVVESTLISIPPFVSALLLIFIFALRLRNSFFHFPVTGWVYLNVNLASNLRFAFLPALTLALGEIPAYTRLLRADMIATLQEDYILAARAKGLPTWRILTRHALRPSSVSLVTLGALSMGRLIGGCVIVETIFALPGLGQLITLDIVGKDPVALQGTVMFIAILYVLINTLVDLAYGYLDPRVRARSA
jgi:peptide/nickel transport system permease protein